MNMLTVLLGMFPNAVLVRFTWDGKFELGGLRSAELIVLNWSHATKHYI